MARSRSSSSDTDQIQPGLANELPLAMAAVIAALIFSHLVQGVVLGALNHGTHSWKLILGHSLRLSLLTAPILLLSLADAGQLHLRGSLTPATALGCAAVTTAFEAVYEAFDGGVGDPLLALPVLLAGIAATLVITRAVTEASAIVSDEPDRPAGFGDAVSLAREIAATASRRPILTGGIGVVIVALAVVAVVARHPAAPTPVTPTGAPSGAAAELTPDVVTPLAPGAAIDLHVQLSADESAAAYGGQAITSQLLGIRIVRRRITVTPLSSGSPTILTAPISFRSAIRPSQVAVTAIPGLGHALAVALAQDGDRIAIEVHNLDDGGRLVARFTSGVVGGATAQRTLALASWAGGGPNLFVVDRSLPGPAIRVQELSASSDYHSVVLDTIRASLGFPTSAWSLDIGPVGGRRPDLVFVTRTATTGSHSIEVHILASGSNYATFLAHMSSTLRQGYAGRQNLFGFVDGSPAWLSVDLAHHRAVPYVLRRASGR